MISFPNAKINIGLRIIQKRSDGYHDLETIFYPIPLRDILEIVAAEAFQCSLYGISIPGDATDNLSSRAFQMIKSDFPAIHPVAIHLFKKIPIGAGLGGGSADGAFTLLALNEFFGLGLTHEALVGYALRLGSDCPFFILNRPCLAGGRGERLEPVQLNLEGYSLVLVHPGLKILTSRAFTLAKPNPSPSRLSSLVQKPPEAWRNEIINDFEEPVFDCYPKLRELKIKLYSAGALYASMTGSGSSFYGIFEKRHLPPKNFLDDYPIPLTSDFIS